MGRQGEHVDCIVVGAGISGVSAAKSLIEAGLSVCVLEKSRGIGGRLATRRIEGERFDHGAQFFTARSPEFALVVEGWLEKRLARSWFGEPDQVRYRAVEGMSALVKQLASGIDVRREWRVAQIDFEEQNWTLRSDTKCVQGTRLLLTNPGPQASDLLVNMDALSESSFLETLATIDYEKCIALMLRLNSELGLSPVGFSRMEPGEPIATIMETSANGSTQCPGLVIHSGPKFAEANFAKAPDKIVDRLVGALPSGNSLKIEAMSLQKWRYAKRKPHGLSSSFLKDEHLPLWHAGDGYVSGRVEGAYLSGIRAAESIIDSFEPTQKSAMETH